MKITTGKIAKSRKIVIYGTEGVGKSTFAAQFPNPIFSDTEGSTTEMDVPRFDKPTSFAMLLAQIDYIRNNPTVCSTYVIDTIDWAEKLCAQAVCDEKNVAGIEDLGYGKGYTYVYEKMGKIINALDELIDRGINVVLTAHAAIRKFEQPDEMGAYDRWELKLINSQKCSVSAMIKEWADILLFATYKTYAVAVDDKGKKVKAQGGKRIMYATHHPCWDAKNRSGLPDEMPFDFAQIAHLFSAAPTASSSAPAPAPAPVPVVAPAPEADDIGDLSGFVPLSEPVIPDGIPKALADLMRADAVSEDEIRYAVSSKGYFPVDTPITNYPPDFINGCLIAAWGAVREIIIDSRSCPFE